MKCPKCQAQFKDPGRAKGGRNRWRPVPKKDRPEVMRGVRAGNNAPHRSGGAGESHE